MLNNIKNILLPLLIIVVISCEKAETPIVLPQAEGKKFEFNLGDHYSNQVYVNLDHGALNTVSSKSWDLAFDCNPNSHNIYMNGGKSVLIAKAGESMPFGPIDLYSLTWEWDAPNGHDDSLMLKYWCDPFGNGYNMTYVIDRGPTYADDERYFQFVLIGTNYYNYHIVFADLHGNYIGTFDIARDHTKNQVYFSFGNGGEVLNFEPDVNSWDFCFLKYRWIYYEFNPPLLYEVAGTYINPNNLSISIDSTLAFNKIGIPHFSTHRFTSNRDALGFDWKVPVFNPTGVVYRTRDYVTYLIRKKTPHRKEQLYKLRFIDFYNTSGDKGNPVYELVRLQ